MSESLKLLFEVSSLHTRISREVEKKFSIHGVSFSEFLVMHHLAQSASKTMRRIDLAEAVGMSASGITRMLAPLEKLGIVEKEVSPRDARVSFVRLSGAGEALYENVLQSAAEVADTVFGALGDKRAQSLLKTIAAIKG